MDMLLLVVTLLSLAATIGLSVLVVRLLRDDRQRSDARVSLLQQLAGEQAGAITARLRPEVAQAGDDPVPMPHASDRAGGGLFALPEVESPWTSRLGIIGVAALVFAALITIAIVGGRPSSSEPAQASRTAAPAPLALVSLTHSRQNGAFRIAGMVENPRGAIPLTHVAAVALLFDERGGLIGTGRAPLDFTTLGPGDESPFVISVPLDRAVARYRVSFRGEDGHVVAHVDRRSSPSVARNE